MELALCHPSGTKNFDVTPRFLKKLRDPNNGTLIMDATNIYIQSFFAKKHSLLKHKMLQLTLKISLYMAATCFGPFGPSSGSICRNLAKVTVFVELLVKIHR
jgi:hypothetical protein